MVLRQDMQESDAAHARVLAETLKEQEGNPPASSRSPEQIQLDLKELARRCEIEPRSFDDHWAHMFQLDGLCAHHDRLRCCQEALQ